MYARPTISGEPTTFGVSGKLWRDALVMYDRETRSLWTQIRGTALAGPMQGRRLEEVPSELTTWAEWRRRHPETLVLVKPRIRDSAYRAYHADPDSIGVRGTRNPDPRLPGKELVIGIERGERSFALTLKNAERAGVSNLEAGDLPLVVVARAGGVRAWDRRLGGEVLTFYPSETDPLVRIRDRETASEWEMATGLSVSGPAKGSRLEPVPVRVVYWGVWAQFHRGTTILRP